MNPTMMLCADAASLQNPEMLGMAEEAVMGQDWLLCAAEAQECRDLARTLPADVGVWVASCDDMTAINLAAALKRDSPDRRVALVSFAPDGSLASRAVRAGIDDLLDQPSFLRDYAEAKRAVRSGGTADDPSLSDAVADEDGRSESEEQDCTPAQQARRVDLSDMNPFGGIRRKMAKQEGTQLFGGPRLAAEPSTHAARPQTAVRSAVAARGIVVAVMSASGGCGKSAFAATAALRAARKGVRTVVVDADLQFGDMEHLLGAEEALCLDEAVAHRATVDMLCAKDFDGAPALVSPPSKMEDAEALSGELRWVVRRLQDSFDLVVVNTGVFWLEAHAVILECADAVVFMMDQRPSSLRATARAVDLCARMGIATSTFTFAINRYARSGMISTVDASCALRGADVRTLADGGTEVEELLGAGYGPDLAGLRNAFCQSVDEIVMPLVTVPVSEDVRPSVPLPKKRWFARKGRGEP